MRLILETWRYLSIHRSRVTQIKLTIVDSENTWRPQGGKPLSEPMMYYCNLNLGVDLSDVLIKIRSLYKNAFDNIGWKATDILFRPQHWQENVFILMKFLSSAVLEVVILITSSAASDTNFVKITFSFQWMFNYKSATPVNHKLILDLSVQADSILISSCVQVTDDGDL